MWCYARIRAMKGKGFWLIEGERNALSDMW